MTSFVCLSLSVRPFIKTWGFLWRRLTMIYRLYMQQSKCIKNIKFRYITGSGTGVIIKPAAKKLVQILKLVMKTHGRYHGKIAFYSGIERNWIVENNPKYYKIYKRSTTGQQQNASRYVTSLLRTQSYHLQTQTETGGRLNKKDGLTKYGDSHVKDKTS